MSRTRKIHVQLNRRVATARGRSGRGSPRDDILQAAARVLATIGYADLTMRAVANEAGLAVGNLVYHFPSKRGLVHALILALVAQYQGKSNEYLTNAKGIRHAGFGNLIRWVIYDSVSHDTSRLFRELWAMSLHDKAIAAAMDGFYQQAHRTAAGLLLLARPGLAPQRAHDIVQLMGVVSEGANVIYATAGRSKASLRRVADLASTLLLYAASDNVSLTPGRSSGIAAKGALSRRRR